MLAVAEATFLFTCSSLKVKGDSSDMEVRFEQRRRPWRQGDPPKEWPLLMQNIWFVWAEAEASLSCWLRLVLKARDAHGPEWSGWNRLCLSWSACQRISESLAGVGDAAPSVTVEQVCDSIRQVPMVSWRQSLKEYFDKSNAGPQDAKEEEV